MNILLTSFGLGETFNLEQHKNLSLFYRMTPMKLVDFELMPDIAVLLLFNKAFMDEGTYYSLDKLVKQEDFKKVKITNAKETLKELVNEGFIELVDYAEILKNNEQLLGKMLENDINSIENWINPLAESVKIWNSSNLSNLFHNSTHYFAGFIPYSAHMAGREKSVSETVLTLLRHNKNEEALGHFKRILIPYLQNVNANLVLSQYLNTGFHDWHDFYPFYRQKFLSIGQGELLIEKESRVVNQLFEVSFPEFSVTNAKKFMRIITDNRITELRNLIQDAVDGIVEFNLEFAKNTFKEVLKNERNIYRYRNIVSYLTIPLGLLTLNPAISTLVQKGTEEIIGKIIEDEFKQNHKWFYLLSGEKDFPNSHK